MELHEILTAHYEKIEKLRGNLEGNEYKCVHKRTQKAVILKEVKEDARDVEFFKRMSVWIDLLGHDGISELYYVHKIGDKLYIVYETMEASLDRVITARILQEVHNQYIMYQIVRILKYAHSANVIFIALRSNRFGIDSESLVKLESFHEAVVGVAEETVDRVANQWYRAPEQLIGLKAHQTSAVDMWALGCILGELLSQNQPPFRGTSAYNQLEKILKYVECTKQDLVEMATATGIEAVERLIPSEGVRDFNEIYPQASDDALDLLKKLLQFNPKNRITANEALKHRYLTDFSNGMPEIDCPNKATQFQYDNENVSRNDLTQRLVDQFRQKVFGPITDAKILAHNIARSSDALALLPIEIWTVILSWLEYPKHGSCENLAREIFAKYLKAKKHG